MMRGMGRRDLAVAAAAGVSLMVAVVWIWSRDRQETSPDARSITMPASSPSPSASGSAQPALSRCKEASVIDLHFEFSDKEAPWQRDRRYELELVFDDGGYSCDFDVPVQSYFGREGYCRFTTRPNLIAAPFGLNLVVPGRPARVAARILSAGSVFYRGVALPRYDEPSPRCEYDVPLTFVAETAQD
jgi:hypothetical protein